MTTARNTTFACVLWLLLGCPSDEETPPQQDTSESSDAGPGESSGTMTTTLDTTADTTTADTSAGESESSTGGDECLGPDGCWQCEPTENEHLLNQCTDASCDPFPLTQKRLPLLGADGSLPPLP